MDHKCLYAWVYCNKFFRVLHNHEFVTIIVCMKHAPQPQPAVIAVDIALSILVYLWIYIWKGVALWKSSHERQTGWFIAFIVLIALRLDLAELSLLEIIYLFFFARNKLTLQTTLEAIRSFFTGDALLFWKRKKIAKKS
jgi:hypothetical protein